jgi:hypothetical protein
MTTQTEEQITPVSSDGGDGFRVVLLITIGLMVAGAIASIAGSSRSFSSPQRLMTIYSVSMTTFVALIPLVALAVIALRGLRQFPWLGWVLPGYIFLSGLNGLVVFFSNYLFSRDISHSFPRPDLGLVFSVVLMVVGGVLFLIRPRPATSTEPSV